MTKCLITGGAGFIVSNFTEYLLGKKFDVTVVDNLFTGKLDNIKHLKKSIKFIKGDIRDLGLLVKASAGADFIFHLAALPSVNRSVKDPVESNSVNVSGTLNVFQAAVKNRVKRVVFASSSSVYGDAITLPKVETMTPNPLSPYALTKLVGEEYARLYASLYSLDVVCLRYFNVFGPRQDPKSEYAAVIPKFITAVQKGEELTIYGDGRQTRDFTYIDNVVRANYLAAVTKKAGNMVFNIAAGKRISLLDLLRLIGEISGKKAAYRLSPRRPGDVKHSLAGIKKAGKYMNYRPVTDFKKGMIKTYGWFSENSEL